MYKYIIFPSIHTNKHTHTHTDTLTDMHTHDRVVHVNTVLVEENIQ